MTLLAYDKIINKLDRTKTWYDNKKKSILSREIEYRDYNSVVKRYNPNYDNYTYYIIMSDTVNNLHCFKRTIVDDYGRLKINIGCIVSETFLKDIDKPCNISVTCVEYNKDYSVYELDV
uniref:Uncharacterized protein n=1 Tax=Geladintestivirus 2 TaxID=3233134 RepID=A0AAU8MHW9_9CAUD